MATFSDLLGAVSTAQKADETDIANIAADQAKLAADTQQKVDDDAAVVSSQTALAAAITTSGGFFVQNPDGTVTAYLPSPGATPAYSTIVLKPDSSPIP